jgi:carbon-monoxide dehydrogenase medium subunit
MAARPFTCLFQTLLKLSGWENLFMRYEAPTNIHSAIELLTTESGECRILAGGSDVLVQLRSGLVEPELIVDIKRIDGMRDISQSGDGYRIGAAVSCAELAEHVGLCADYPGVVEAANLIGSTQVQGRATVVGNLCNASPAADSVPALVAARTQVEIIGQKGTRTVAVEDIPARPGRTNLAQGDIITAVLLPQKPTGMGDAYLRFIPRTEMDIAVVGVGVNLQVDNSGAITSARVSLGAVAPTVLLVEPAAAAIIGKNLDDAALDALAAAASAACTPIDDKRGTIEFRVEVAGVLARRAARIAYDRARTS